MGPGQCPPSLPENSAGVTVVSPGDEAPGAIVITVPEEGGPIKLAPGPGQPASPRRTRYGLLPKTGPDGANAGQDLCPPPWPGAGHQAGRLCRCCWSGGLGISQNGTAEAVARLERGLARLRPLWHGAGTHGAACPRPARSSSSCRWSPDYPDNDPGPHTLLTGPKAQDNIDKLHWSLGRFTGYVGIVNFLGGRLTADQDALTPILREFAGRGLMVVDDGSSPRSLLASAATRAQIPALKIDRVADGVTRADAIDKELAGLWVAGARAGRRRRRRQCPCRSRSTASSRAGPRRHWRRVRIRTRPCPARLAAATPQTTEIRLSAGSPAMTEAAPERLPPLRRGLRFVQCRKRPGLRRPARRQGQACRAYVALGRSGRCPKAASMPVTLSGSGPPRAAGRDQRHLGRGWWPRRRDWLRLTTAPSTSARKYGRVAGAGRRESGSPSASTGPESEIDILTRPAATEAEFDAWRWVRLEETPDRSSPSSRASIGRSCSTSRRLRAAEEITVEPSGALRS